LSVLPRIDPYPNFNFDLVVEGLLVGSFSEVSGLGAETEVEEYKEGGVNDFVHKIIGKTRYGPLVLRRGMTLSPVLYNWYKDVVSGKIEKKLIIVTLLDAQKIPVKAWTFKNAFPIKWNGPELKSDSSSIAVESTELVHQGLVWLPSVGIGGL
jgi:phage tail-like protein